MMFSSCWYSSLSRQSITTVIQKEGLAMGAPTSSILSEIFLQHVQYTLLPQLTSKQKFINYFQYVDDILLIYDSTKLHKFNSDSKVIT